MLVPIAMILSLHSSAIIVLERGSAHWEADDVLEVKVGVIAHAIGPADNQIVRCVIRNRDHQVISVEDSPIPHIDADDYYRADIIGPALHERPARIDCTTKTGRI